MNYHFIKPLDEPQSILKVSVNLYKFSKFLKNIFVKCLLFNQNANIKKRHERNEIYAFITFVLYLYLLPNLPSPKIKCVCL